MLKLKDILETLKGDVAIYLRDGHPDDLVVTEPIPAEEVRDKMIKIGMRFFNYYILEMYATEYMIGVDEELPCIKIVLVR